MKPLWMLLLVIANCLLFCLHLWLWRKRSGEFREQMQHSLDAAMAGMELRHVAQMEAIREVWSQIKSDGEPPEMLAELAREEERYRQEVESMRKTRDDLRGSL